MATTTSIVEQCQVAPSSGAPTELLLPLIYSDIVYLSRSPSDLVLFYSLPCSKSHFLDTIVPKLKNSLSLTLKHFPPLAGKIIFPLTSPNMPVSHYVDGDSVSLTIAVSDGDFNHHSGNCSRDPNELHDFVAHLPPLAYLSDSIKFSVAAIQVTLFPDQGICVGVTQHHAIGDGSTMIRFINMWASISKLDGDSHLLASSKFLPYYDRSGFQVANALTTAYWNLMKTEMPVVSPPESLPARYIRATFVVSGEHIQKLKNSISSRASSYTAVCAHVWTSLARSAGKEVADDKPEYFKFSVDLRGGLTPPLPHTYFGNCLAHGLAESTHGRLKGDQGIVVAAEVIEEAINNKKAILHGSVQRILQVIKAKENRVLVIAGSPRFDLYAAADFGLGRLNKFDVGHMYPGFVWLFRSREFPGGVEIQLVMPRIEMDAFASSFNQGLREATAQNTKTDHLSRL